MANRISDRMVKAFERFNADLKAFGEETGEIFVTPYEGQHHKDGEWIQTLQEWETLLV